MEKKLLNFCIYRYHLLPLTVNVSQTELFPNLKPTIEELKERKNEYFSLELNKLESDPSNGNPIKLHFREDEYYIFKVANKKKAVITKNFKKETIENEPYVYVLINNDPSVQKIAISDNTNAFSSPGVVKTILKTLFRKDLEQYGLNIEIEQLFNATDFWEYIKTYKSVVTYLNFQFIKPNLANISKSLPEAFKLASDNVNSHESHITFKAPERGVLENIDKKNKDINGLVDYASEGGGTIKLKVKNIRKQLNTNDKPIIIQADEISIEGAAEQVVKMFKTIIE